MLYTNEEIEKRRKSEIKWKKIRAIAMYIILIPMMIYNITLIIQAIVKPSETPSFLGIKTYVIISGSMEPNINIGDIVITKKLDESELSVGDVISYRKGQNVITHRIVRINVEGGEWSVVTKGDNNNTDDDEKILYSNIEGKVIQRIPKIGKITLMLQNKMIILIILLCFYIYWSRSYKINARKNSRRLKRLAYEEKHKITND